MGSELSLDRGHRLETPRTRVFTSEIAALEPTRILGATRTRGAVGASQ